MEQQQHINIYPVLAEYTVIPHPTSLIGSHAMTKSGFDVKGM